MLCGTFPPKKDKWAMDFFYPNFYNDMWRVFGLLFFGEKDHFFNIMDKTIDKENIKKMLAEYRIGIGETTVEAVRTKDNASDKYLEIITPVDLPQLLDKIPECKAIVTTGEKAASVISRLTDTDLPKMGGMSVCKVKMTDGSIRKINHWRMPSTSRAYPMKLEQKAEFYRNMLLKEGIIS